MRDLIIGIVVAATLLVAGVWIGYEWRGRSFSEAAMALQARKLAEEQARNAALATDLAQARRDADAAARRAETADQDRIAALDRMAKVLSGIDPAELAAVNEVLR